jgi:23S rRNA pseudouridine1911/1915/1917 synthase
MVSHTITEDTAGQRLDHFLREQLGDVSRARVQMWIDEDRVLVNGSPAKASYRLRVGDSVETEPAPPPSLKAEAEDIPLIVLYEDDDLVAIDKPAGMVVHAGAGIHNGTLVNALLHRYGNSLSTGSADERPGIVHRLDRFTSGVILAARNDAAHQSLARQFSNREVEKEYLALVHGVVRADTGRIEKPVGRDPVQRAKMSVRSKVGRSALTDWKVEQRFDGYTFVRLRIGTGRTHQIRVHMASIGHPVVGDRLYGAPQHPKGLPAPERYFLHAHRIVLSHPRSHTRLDISSPLTPDIKEWMSILSPYR